MTAIMIIYNINESKGVKTADAPYNWEEIIAVEKKLHHNCSLISARVVIVFIAELKVLVQDHCHARHPQQ